jgi:hypothetical protein
VQSDLKLFGKLSSMVCSLIIFLFYLPIPLIYNYINLKLGVDVSQLSVEQKEVLKMALQGNNIFLTGPAGMYNTFFKNFIIIMI